MNSRIGKAKRSYITRNVDLSTAAQLNQQVPVKGDLMLARVDRIRQHTRLENTQGRREHLYPGDEIIVAASDRYATGQFYARVPEQLGACHLVAAGGIAAEVIQRNRGIKAATEITTLGVLCDSQGAVINLSRFAPLNDVNVDLISQKKVPTLLVMGSDMDSGKTTLACAAVNGLRQLGYRISATKLTGTGAGPDYWRMHDSGADRVVDFLDAGFPSTVGLEAHQLVSLLQQFKADAVDSGSDILIVEVADGILQPDNKALLGSDAFVNEISAALIAADGAIAATMTTQTVLQAGISVLGIGGVISKAPLSCNEMQESLGLPLLGLSDFHKDECRDYILGSLFGAEYYAAAHTG
ncbi:DUF1611 domain-containing protein [Amphritea balenae]|uniref:DUF1611 domain-containing protein n=1 Tax=Amphritea balenae TaxID=452629 RepID=A0A3P1SR45_9GAMM|nr:DUF1611 domain-containing protein [Amphritea balenae]RRC99580.1 DUF1611 domain-containing protein [Amphritea balenae]GGK78245.1 DUF1611 domain-containing protein [Amphritea balenae]